MGVNTINEAILRAFTAGTCFMFPSAFVRSKYINCICWQENNCVHTRPTSLLTATVGSKIRICRAWTLFACIGYCFAECNLTLTTGSA